MRYSRSRFKKPVYAKYKWIAIVFVWAVIVFIEVIIDLVLNLSSLADFGLTVAAGLLISYIAITLCVYRLDYVENLLFRSKRRYEDLIEQTSDLAICVDNKGVISYANPSMIYTLGRGDIIGLHALEIFSEESREKLKEENQKTVEGRSRSYEAQLIAADNSAIDVLVSLNPLYDNHGDLKGSFSIFKNITDRKKMENITLERAKVETVCGAAITLSHRINNFLATIVGEAQLLSLDLKDVKYNNRMQKIQKACNNIAKFLNEMASATRVKMVPYAGGTNMIDFYSD